MPYQMFACAFVGMLAGLLPKARGKAEVAMLAGYAAVAGYLFGFLLNLSFWPFALDPTSSIAYVPGLPVLEQLQRYLTFLTVTSLAWDTGRAITTAVLVILVGPAILRALRRAARRANFNPTKTFGERPQRPVEAGRRRSEAGGDTALLSCHDWLAATDMSRYWPRRADGLPAGQRLLQEMPRFTDLPHRPPPEMPVEPRLEIRHEGEPIALVTGADLRALKPRDHRADFHCVTGWTVKDLVWTGVPLREVLASIGITQPPSPYLVARTGDRRKAAFLWEDAVAENVILATHLNGVPLDDRHGKPLRLVSPSQYGYKSVKHLVAIDFRANEPKVMSKEHLRARIAVEERHPTLPNWVVRLPYRLTVAPTAYIAERTLRRHRATKSG